MGTGWEWDGEGGNWEQQVGPIRGLRIITRDTSKWKWKLRLRKTLTVRKYDDERRRNEIVSEIGWGIIYEAGGWELWIPSERSCSLLGLPKC